jgi:hypothetical protein
MPVTNEVEYDAAMSQIDAFIQNPPKLGSAEAERFVFLLREVQVYEGVQESEEDSAITYEIKGIKCDTVGCSFVDENVTVSQYQEWLNRPCEKCGGNLLTEADFNTVRMLIGVSDTINRIAPALDLDQGEKIEVSFEFDGSGTPKMVTKT